MDRELLERCRRHGAIETLRSGDDAIRATLQVAGLPPVNRGERRSLLQDAFERLRSELERDDVELLPDTLSVSAQTMEALIPVDRYDAAIARLKRRNVRVDPAIERLVVD